jgi:hypothetical protein
MLHHELNRDLTALIDQARSIPLDSQVKTWITGAIF